MFALNGMEVLISETWKRLDYSNAVFTGLSKKLLDSSNASRILLSLNSGLRRETTLVHCTDFPVCQIIKLKISLVVYKALNGLQDTVICDLLVF